MKKRVEGVEKVLLVIKDSSFFFFVNVLSVEVTTQSLRSQHQKQTEIIIIIIIL